MFYTKIIKNYVRFFLVTKSFLIQKFFRLLIFFNNLLMWVNLIYKVINNFKAKWNDDNFDNSLNECGCGSS